MESMYSLAFFNGLIWVSLVGLLVVFGFQVWFTLVDYKNNKKAKGE